VIDYVAAVSAASQQAPQVFPYTSKQDTKRCRYELPPLNPPRPPSIATIQQWSSQSVVLLLEPLTRNFAAIAATADETIVRCFTPILPISRAALFWLLLRIYLICLPPTLFNSAA
jgi:hypothetical protein